ncbi:MAG: YidB family protein [Tardiphaga sp.]
MGLLDILNGMANGPRGPSDPNDKSGGMSPMTMAILALLAYKGYKHFKGAQPGQVTQSPSPTPMPAPNTTQADSGGLGGMLGSIFGGQSSQHGQAGGAQGGGLGGLLGGLLAGGAAGSVLSGGLGDLLKQFQQSGHGEVANSWVSPGPNRQIAPNDLADALGADQIDQLTSRTGLSREQLLQDLSQELPDAVDDFTPEGRVPTEDEARSRWV